MREKRDRPDSNLEANRSTQKTKEKTIWRRKKGK